MTSKMRIVLVLAFFAVVGLMAVTYSKSRSASSQPTGATTPQTISKNTDSSWSKRCDAPQEGAENQKPYCEAFQILSVTETKQKFLEFAVGYRGSPAVANAALLLPLGIQVNAGGIMQIDEEEQAEQFTIETCLPAGCISRFALKPELVSKMSAGQNLYISFADAQGQTMKIQLPLQGFAMTLESIQK